MAEELLQVRLHDVDSLIIGNFGLKRILSYEKQENHRVIGGEYENWKVKIARDIVTGTSYWCYLGKLNSILE